MQPLVSVVCMAFNQVEYISDCLEGFIKQETNFPFEVLVHDDCSTDGTAEVIRDFASRYPDVVIPVFETENQYSKGVQIYRQILRPLSRGKYIAFCEGDDYWFDRSKLQKQFDFLESRPDFSLVIHNSIILDYTSDLIYLSEPDTGDREKGLDDLILQGGGLINPTASMFLRKSCDKYYRDSYHAPVGDHFNLIRLASFGKVMWLSEPMSVYRYGANGSFTENMAIESAEYFKSYTDRYVNGLILIQADLGGRSKEAFDRRIEFQKNEGIRQAKSSEFVSSSSFDIGLIRGLSLRDRARAVMRRVLPLKLYWMIRRWDKARRCRKLGTLLCRSTLQQPSQIVLNTENA